MAKSARKRKKTEPLKGVDARINNNDAELHQSEEAADDRARVRAQAGPAAGLKR
jgi:hypothetical protein